MAWRNMTRWLAHLEKKGELLRISEPVDVELEAGAIADRLVKSGGSAVLFENPRLPIGDISDIPLAMNLFGTHDRTLRALGAAHPTEVGERLVALMKPDIGTFVKRPWKAWPLAKRALALPPKKVRKGACQQVRMAVPDMTKLPIPTTWMHDGGHSSHFPWLLQKTQRHRSIISECTGPKCLVLLRLDCTGKCTNMVQSMLKRMMGKCPLRFVWEALLR